MSTNHLTTRQTKTMIRRAILSLTADQRAAYAVDALSHLRAALACIDCARAPKTAARIRLAISSAAGAVRNAENRATRAREARR